MEPEAVSELEKEELKQRREILRIAKDNPELLDTVEELEPLIKTLGGDTEVIETANDFVEAAEK